MSNDPDRYLLAFVEAHKIALKKSDRAAAKLVAAFAVGNEIAVPKDAREAIKAHGPEVGQMVAKIAANCPAGFVTFGCGPNGPERADGTIINTSRGARSASIEGRAATLREKGRRWRNDPERRVWLHWMTVAFSFTLMPWIPIARARVGVFMAARRAGEHQVAKDVIFPMLELARGRATLAPDFSTTYPSTT
jgi:hypothetical protein